MFLSAAVKAGRLFSRSRLVNLQHAGHGVVGRGRGCEASAGGLVRHP
jgi:hypothetical protein